MTISWKTYGKRKSDGIENINDTPNPEAESSTDSTFPNSTTYSGTSTN